MASRPSFVGKRGHVKQGLAVSLDGELVMSGRWSGGRVLDACGCRKELVLRNARKGYGGYCGLIVEGIDKVER
ncbi:hypothetical protein CLOP_g12214 [Closterium sp. NIES-67]|nr:hypothetical protein CLOP_g12214 [Closterium sp. NIES-67]